MSDLLRDLRHAVRTLARRPGLAVMATVSLATGIGLTVTTYSFLNALYAGPKGIVHPEELVQVVFPMLKQSGVGDLRRELAPLADAAGFAPTAARSVTAAGEERLVVELVTDNYFSVLGLIPAEGRALGPSDLTRPSGPAPIVISHALWQNRFLGGKVAGLASLLGTEPVVIVGVAPRGFRGMTPVFRADAWALAGTFGTEKARAGLFSVIARLRPGATPNPGPANRRSHDSTTRLRGVREQGTRVGAQAGRFAPRGLASHRRVDRSGRPPARRRVRKRRWVAPGEARGASP